VITGWFSEFESLAQRDGGVPVGYGEGAARFAGATYDPTSNYRAACVFDFFHTQGLSTDLLRQVSQHQVGLLADRFDARDADPALVRRDRTVALAGLGGFLALQSPRADVLCRGLRRRGVLADHRGNILRLGPAPYLSDEQLGAAIEALGSLAEELAPR
jgi:kynureninase